jgi:AraC-like DNA-binding protein
MPDVDRLVTKCLGVTTVAIVSERSSAVSESLVSLGACGVQRVLDVTGRDGWSGLRSLMADTDLDATPVIGGALVEVLDDVTDGTRRYFGALVRTAPRMPTVRGFTQAMGVHPSTFTSRFLRAHLPSPKRYLAATRLLYASALLETPRVSIVTVAYRLGYSSPQSFGRHVRAATGMAAGEFRRRHTFAGLLESYLSTLVVPFRETLRWFDPLGHGIVLADHMECDTRR